MLAATLVFLAVLAAASLEVFEAFVIVTTVGHEIGMRRAAISALVATTLLVALTAALGSLVLALPGVQIATGTILFCFGARWLIKSVLKLSGRIASHHEPPPTRLTRWAGQLVAAKGTFMEGVEVVIIVGAMAGSQRGPAIAGALTAIVLVLAVGYALRRALTGIPKLYLKFAVGSMMCSFGTFFAGEGLGVAWPVKDLALLYGAACFATLGLLATRLLSQPAIPRRAS